MFFPPIREQESFPTIVPLDQSETRILPRRIYTGLIPIVGKLWATVAAVYMYCRSMNTGDLPDVINYTKHILYSNFNIRRINFNLLITEERAT